MAASLTLASATPYALKYTYAHDGAGGAGSGTEDVGQIQMLADLESAGIKSPLREFLAGVTTDGAWAALATGPIVSITVTLRGALAAVAADFDAIVAPETRVLRVVGADGTADQLATVEIRFHHTIDR